MAERQVPTEVEAKLLIPTERELRAIARLGRVGRYRARPHGAVRLHSVYVDTSELTLLRHGVALRVRAQGRRWEMTAKWSGRVDGAVHARPELTVPLSAAPRPPYALPAGPLRDHLQALVAGRALSPILVTDIHRRLYDLLPLDDAAPPVAELALDRVHLHAAAGRGAAALSYFEAEIELRDGSPRDVVAIARSLRRRFGLALSRESKFARGMALLYGPGVLSSLDLRAVGPNDTLGEAVRKILGVQLEKLRASDPGTRLGEDPEALHDMRVATRRARAALRAFGDGLPKPVRDYLGGELRWLGRLLGGVRDLDVQLGALAARRAAVPADHAPALDGFASHLGTERAQRRTQLLAALRSPRYLRFLRELEAQTRSAPPPPAATEPAEAALAALARQRVRRAYRRLIKRGKRVHGAPTAEDLHALRIRSKRLRYLLEFMRDFLDAPGRRVIKQLVRLQDVLGAHQDAVVAAQRVRDFVRRENAGTQPAELIPLDALLGAEVRATDRAYDELVEAWQHFSGARTGADVAAALERLRVLAAPDGGDASETPA